MNLEEILRDRQEIQYMVMHFEDDDFWCAGILPSYEEAKQKITNKKQFIVKRITKYEKVEE